MAAEHDLAPTIRKDGSPTTPARGYSWEPFKPGNTKSLQHGAYSPRKVDPLAADLVAGVLARAEEAGSSTAYLLDATYRPALWAWARAEAQCQILTEYLVAAAELTGDGVGDLDADRVKSAYTLLHRAESRAESGRTRLGLDPLSRSRLRVDDARASVDMARLMGEEVRRMELESRQTPSAPVSGPQGKGVPLPQPGEGSGDEPAVSGALPGSDTGHDRTARGRTTGGGDR